MSDDDGGRLLSGSFLWLNAAQFLGALNDNLFKLLVMFFLISGGGAESAERMAALAGAIFVIPFLIFLPAAGVMADRCSKGIIVRWMKVLEVAVMLLGLAAMAAGSAAGVAATLFLMAAQSALFSPSKYGIIPEIVRGDRLAEANGVLTMLTYVAIVVGSAAAPTLAEILGSYTAVQAVCVGIALAGTMAALGVRRTEPAGSTQRASAVFLRDAWRTLRGLRGRRRLMAAVLGSAYFSLIGAYMQLNIIPFGMRHLGLTQGRSGYLFFLAAVGIAAGAVLAGRVSGSGIRLGIAPAGALGMALFSAGLALLPHRWAFVPAMVFGVGMSAGLFIVPLDAYIQREAPSARRGEVLAAGNALGWVGVLAASGLVAGFAAIGLTPAQGFLAMTLPTAAVAWRMRGAMAENE